MFNPVEHNRPAPAAADAGTNKRKESERPELEDIERYIKTHASNDKYFGSYLQRLFTLQEQTRKDDPSQAKIAALIDKCFGSTPAQTQAKEEEASQTKKSRKPRKEVLFEQTYQLKILPEQMESIKKEIDNSNPDLKKQEEIRLRGLNQLVDLYLKFPNDQRVASLYKTHFPDVVIPEASQPAVVQATAQPQRSSETQILSDDYDALRKVHMEIELVKIEQLEAFNQLLNLPADVKINKVDPRYINFSQSIDNIIKYLASNTINVVAIIQELSKDTQSSILDQVKEKILLAIAESNVTITKEWLRTLLAECSYGSENAPMDATPEKFWELIKEEIQRHREFMVGIKRKLESVPDASALLHLSSSGSFPLTK